ELPPRVVERAPPASAGRFLAAADRARLKGIVPAPDQVLYGARIASLPPSPVVSGTPSSSQKWLATPVEGACTLVHVDSYTVGHTPDGYGAPTPDRRGALLCLHLTVEPRH